MNKFKQKSLLCALMLLATPGAVSAQQVAAASAVTYIDRPAIAPGASLGTPMAFGAKWGQGFIGVSGTDGTGNVRKTDGSMAVGFGLGDPAETVGLEVTTAIISLKTRFGDSGTVNAKLHRWLPWNSAIAIGVENAATWGTAKKAPNVKANGYLALSKVFALQPDNPYHPYYLIVSGGFGNGRFQSNVFDAYTPNVNYNKIGGFASVGFHFHPQASLVASWTGKDLNAGLSIVPLHDYPIVLNLGAVDLLKHNQPKTRFIGSLGYAYF
jgi:hypothetical protein